MKKHLLAILFTVTVFQAFGQTNSPWKLISADRGSAVDRIRDTQYSENQKLVTFDSEVFSQLLANVSDVKLNQPGIEIQFPNINGELERFLVWESSNFEADLQSRFPEIRAFAGKGITDPSARLNFSFSPYGIQTMVVRADKGSEYIEPYTKDNSIYVIFDSATRTKERLSFNCNTEDVELNQSVSDGAAAKASNQVYKTLRLALSCTGEYAQYFGGTVSKALSAMNATMTRVNGILEIDLAVKLLMIDNTSIIYTSPSSDPYSPVVGGNAPNSWGSELQTTLTNEVGESNYDIGHLFGASGGGGNAGCVGCVCVNGQKGSAYTSPSNNKPQGDTFDIDYVVHEMGHQLGANHTFSYGGVSGSENTSYNIEPGSGSTIMGYAGITGATDVQSHSDPYFAYRSIAQIQTNLAQPSKNCAISYNSSTSPAYANMKPAVSSGASYSIPAGTAFKLVGSGSGTEGETLTYCWEQNNDATIVTPDDSFPSPTKTDGPNFRSLLPSLSPVRYMPPLKDVLEGNLFPTWEMISTVSRSLNFTLTVRDNAPGGGQTNTSSSLITVVDTGSAFAVTSPSIEDVSWELGSTQTITWNVAGTTGNGINTSNVNILLSTDGGQTFSIVLASNTNNDGSETIIMPNEASPYCRIMIEAVGNLFYAVSPNVALGYSFSNICTTYTNNASMSIPDGAGINVAGTTVSKSISVPLTGILTDVNTTVSGTHPWIWDLIVSLQHPDGSVVKLLNRKCNNSSSGFNILFNDGAPAIVCSTNVNGTYAPSDFLSMLNGKNLYGDWLLTATDYYSGKTGTINNWSLEVCGKVPVLATSDFQFSDLAVYPNPSSGNFTIRLSNPTSEAISVSVFDLRGRIIFENSYGNQADFIQNIQLNNADAGMYLLSITAGNYKSVKKLIVD